MSDAQLNAGARLAIREEVTKILLRLATALGVANLLVLLGALWAVSERLSTVAERMELTVTGNVERKVLDNIEGQLTARVTDLNRAVRDADQLIGRLQRSEEDLRLVDERIGALSDQIDTIQRAGNTEEVARVVAALASAPELREFLARLDSIQESVDSVGSTQERLGQILTSDECEHPRVAVGRTPVGSTNWQRYVTTGGTVSARAIFVNVDTGSADFTDTPLYFTSLGGRSTHWDPVGVTSIYSPSNNTLSVYLRSTSDSDIYELATTRDWHINWLGVHCG